MDQGLIQVEDESFEISLFRGREVHPLVQDVVIAQFRGVLDVDHALRALKEVHVEWVLLVLALKRADQRVNVVQIQHFWVLLVRPF